MILVLACAAPEPEAPPPPLPAPAVGLELVPLDTLPEALSTDRGRIDAVEVTGDLDGDGAREVIVAMDDGLRYVVRGPIGSPRRLPGAIWFGLGDGGFVGDATGDGQADLIWRNEDELLLLPGPIPGDPAPGAGMRVDPRTAWIDVDHDGVLDAIGADPGLQLWWGPADTWAPPDFDEPLCEDDGHSPTALVAPGDVDGDGAFELSFALEDDPSVRSCPPVLVSFSRDAGRPAMLLQSNGLDPFTALGDLDGDGLSEVFGGPVGTTLYASPLRWGDWGPSGREVSIPEDLRRVGPLPYDVDGDGLHDALGTWLGLFGGDDWLHVLAPIVGGLDGMEAFDAERGWILDDGPDERILPYDQDGVLHLLIPFEGGWRDAEVGPLVQASTGS